MNQKVILDAEKVIADLASKEGAGYCTLALIDEDGFPSASTVSILKSDGIKTLSFCGGLGDNKAKRAANCNRASICVNSLYYNITLVGTLEILTDGETKKGMWNAFCNEYWTGPEDPDFCVFRFHTQRYNLYVNEGMAEGKL
ncbi:MAG: pyridoxamine 5'-phosphate oxidase family protein [Oscillospiraceae bacterium]|nr:pyridoxamine 5'-phosphate oxidase family protein [Oscillospiraceae bacterium]